MKLQVAFLFLFLTINAVNASCDSLPPSQANLCRLLNEKKPEASAYFRAVADWPPDQVIWDYLESDQARERFAEYIIKNEEPERADAGSIPEKGPTFSRDVCYSFVCRHFARRRFFRFSSEQETILTSDEYPTTKVAKKFRLPIREVFEANAQNTDGHSLNAIFTGGPDSDRNHPQNWLFFEPQTNEIYFSREKKPRWLAPVRGRAWVVLPVDPTLVLDRTAESYYEAARTTDLSEFHKKMAPLPSFIVNNKGRVIALPLPKLDGGGALVPARTNASIAAHDFVAIQDQIVRQRTAQARRAILENVGRESSWNPEEIASLERLKEFSEKMQAEFGETDPNYRFQVGRLFSDLPIDQSDLSYKPWTKPWRDFLKREKVHLSSVQPSVCRAAIILFKTIVNRKR